MCLCFWRTDMPSLTYMCSWPHHCTSSCFTKLKLHFLLEPRYDYTPKWGEFSPEEALEDLFFDLFPATERLADLAIWLSWPQGYQRETSQWVRGMQVHLRLPESPKQKSSVSGSVSMYCSQREWRFLAASLYFIHPMSLYSHQLALQHLTSFPPITEVGWLNDKF